MQVILLVIKFSDNTDIFHCAIQLSCVSQWWKHMNVFLWFHENRHSSRMHYVDIRLWYVTTVLRNCDGCICSDAKYAPGYQHHHAVCNVTCIILRSMHVALQWLNKPCLSRKSISVFVFDGFVATITFYGIFIFVIKAVIFSCIIIIIP